MGCPNDTRMPAVDAGISYDHAIWDEHTRYVASETQRYKHDRRSDIEFIVPQSVVYVLTGSACGSLISICGAEIDASQAVHCLDHVDRGIRARDIISTAMQTQQLAR